MVSDNTWQYERFYDNCLKGQIEQKGEAYMEWHTTKPNMIRTLNWLRSNRNLLMVQFEKYSGCYSIVAKPKPEENEG